jgi:hypothetical protein
MCSVVVHLENQRGGLTQGGAPATPSPLMLAFAPCRDRISMKSLMPLRASMTWKPRSSSQAYRQLEPPWTSPLPPPQASRRLQPWVMPTARARLLPMLPADSLGKLGFQARLPPLWAGSTDGSLQTPETASWPLAPSEGSSTRTNPPWGVSRLRTLRRPGKPRLAQRASHTSRWCVWRLPGVGWVAPSHGGAGVGPHSDSGPFSGCRGHRPWFRNLRPLGGVLPRGAASRVEREGGGCQPEVALFCLPVPRVSLPPLQLSERARERKVPVTRIGRLANFGGEVAGCPVLSLLPCLSRMEVEGQGIWVGSSGLLPSY